jgi:hypothetical protein
MIREFEREEQLASDCAIRHRVLLRLHSPRMLEIRTDTPNFAK